MSYVDRIHRLCRQLAPEARNPVPATEAEFVEGLMAGQIAAADIDGRNPDHIMWLTVFLARMNEQMHGANFGKDGLHARYSHNDEADAGVSGSA